MLKGLLTGVFGTRHERERKRVQPIVDTINEEYERLQSVSEEELKRESEAFVNFRPGEDMVGLEKAFEAATEDYRPGEGRKK